MIGLALGFILVVVIFGGLAYLARQAPLLAGWPANVIAGVCALVIIVAGIFCLAALLRTPIKWPVQ